MNVMTRVVMESKNYASCAVHFQCLVRRYYESRLLWIRLEKCAKKRRYSWSLRRLSGQFWQDFSVVWQVSPPWWLLMGLCKNYRGRLCDFEIAASKGWIATAAFTVPTRSMLCYGIILDAWSVVWTTAICSLSPNGILAVQALLMRMAMQVSLTIFAFFWKLLLL